MKKRKSGHRISIVRTIITTLSVIAMLLIAAYVIFVYRLSSVSEQISSDFVSRKADEIINDAIYDEFIKNNTYNGLIEFEKDYFGSVTALKINMAEVNLIKSKLASKISEELSKTDTLEFSIPLGSIIGGKLTSGKGPDVKVNLITYGISDVEIENEFADNRSRYRIMLKIKASVTIITSVTSKATEVEKYICIAEAVIIDEALTSD